jgi:hypothetical protein
VQLASVLRDGKGGGEGSEHAMSAAVSAECVLADLQPRAFVLTLRSHGQLLDALRNIKKSWPDVPTFALCIDVDRASEAMKNGATSAVRFLPAPLTCMDHASSLK